MEKEWKDEDGLERMLEVFSSLAVWREVPEAA